MDDATVHSTDSSSLHYHPLHASSYGTTTTHPVGVAADIGHMTGSGTLEREWMLPGMRRRRLRDSLMVRRVPAALSAVAEIFIQSTSTSLVEHFNVNFTR